ncbi:HlyD family secretion protein [Rhabdochromatium marinum]|uniref:HlyD family secretion protein n=1 Tax=Rhabdochromatium marinum TaxID=48729 RepID=UPI0019058077|nr:HlyD family secretion protein [Rhabdochromatium marinum]
MPQDHASASAATSPPRAPHRRSWSSIPDPLRVLITLSMVVIACVALLWAWRSQQAHPWTRDGQVLAQVIGVAPQVSGPVVRLHVQDNQPIQAGDLLFELDPRLYQQAVAQAQADLTQAQAEAQSAQADAARATRLHQSGDLADEAYDLKIAASTSAAAVVQAAAARLDAAQLKLQLTRVSAPVSGYVTNLTLDVGHYAQVGVAQLALIDQDSFWVTGYFKETDLPAIRVGAPAAVTLMAHPQQPLRGEVASIAHGIARRNLGTNPSGLAEVSPTFEWIRLAQRIPVHIRLHEPPPEIPLRIGTTASVAILPSPEAAPQTTATP